LEKITQRFDEKKEEKEEEEEEEENEFFHMEMIVLFL
jgi:hypothetical protein